MTRLAGELPVCGPLAGCGQVATSEYSAVFGIPLAVFGLAFSLSIVALVIAAASGSRPAALAAYALGLAGIVVVAYLTYLELFVIHAVCAWCVAYGLTVSLGWAVVAWGVRRLRVHFEERGRSIRKRAGADAYRAPASESRRCPPFEGSAGTPGMTVAAPGGGRHGREQPSSAGRHRRP